MKKQIDQNGQSMVETAVVFPLIIIMALALIQFTIIVTCQLAINFAAYKGARAVLLSSNTSKYFGYGNDNSIVKDANNSVKSSLGIFYPGIGLGWMTPPAVKLFRHEGQSQYGISRNEIIEGNIAQPPNQSIWVVVSSEIILVIPMMKPVFGKILGLIGLTKIKASCIVDTPSQP